MAPWRRRIAPILPLASRSQGDGRKGTAPASGAPAQGECACAPCSGLRVAWLRPPAAGGSSPAREVSLRKRVAPGKQCSFSPHRTLEGSDAVAAAGPLAAGPQPPGPRRSPAARSGSRFGGRPVARGPHVPPPGWALTFGNARPPALTSPPAPTPLRALATQSPTPLLSALSPLGAPDSCASGQRFPLCTETPRGRKPGTLCGFPQPLLNGY